MPHNDRKGAIRRVAYIFGVSYQNAWSCTRQAIKEGLVTNIAVVRGQVAAAIWFKMGFTPVLRSVGDGTASFMATPGPDGLVLVGAAVDADHVGISLPEGESLIELPASALLEINNWLKAGDASDRMRPQPRAQVAGTA